MAVADRTLPQEPIGSVSKSPGVLAERTALVPSRAPTVYRRIKPFLPDRLATAVSYARTFGKIRLFLRPRSFNERVLRKKLTDRNPLLVRTTDKLLVRNYVAQKIGARYLVPLLFATQNPRYIDFDRLPRSFIVKATHGSGWVMAVIDKEAADREEIVATAERWLRTNYYQFNREWALKDVVPRVMLEELLLDDGGAPTDYKFFVLGGKVRLIEVESGRFSDYRENYFDPNWRALGVRTRYRRADVSPPRPCELDEMRRIAETLGQDFEISRIDLYALRGRVFFGEITHYPGQGMYRWHPADFDEALAATWLKNAPIPERYYLGD